MAQPCSDCGKSNFPIVDVRGLASIYSALIVDCKIPAFVQGWMYNRPNLIPTVEKVIYQQWMYSVYPMFIQCLFSLVSRLQNISVCTMLDLQQAQPSSDCGKSNFPKVNEQGWACVHF